MAFDPAIWEGRRALTDNPALGAEVFGRAGRKLLELDLLAEAIDFFARAGDDEGLRAIQARAVEEGHFFLYRNAAARLSAPAGGREDELSRLAEVAEKKGLTLYAAQAKAAKNPAPAAAEG